MSRSFDTNESTPDDNSSDAGFGFCNGCGEPLTAPGDGGHCDSCLLMQANVGIWDPCAPPSMEEIASRLPRFKFEKELGRGGLGTVFGAIDRQLGRIVAIKAMFENPDNPEYSERFEREASAMAKLSHPHIVSIYESGKVDDLHYLVMERMEGGTLADELRSKKKLPLRRAMSVLGQICDALDYVHTLGVIHRDVKPGNILLDRKGNVKLSDFGLVKGMLYEEFAEEALTRTGLAVGTPQYMAPEQLEWPAQANHRADIYSVGAVLYEMMTGEIPQGRYKPVSTFPGVPRFLNAIVDRALNKAPEKRFERAGAMKQEALRRQTAVRRWSIRIGTATALTLFAISGATALDAKRAEARASAVPFPIPQEEIDGLPLGQFDDEIDLDQWYQWADYDFESKGADSMGNQEDLAFSGSVSVDDGKLRLNSLDDFAVVNLKRTWTSAPRGFAVNFKFLPEAYLGVGVQDVVIFEYSLHWKIGVFLQSSKWGNPLPTFLTDLRQPMAPPGVIEPHLPVGQWHDVWIVLTDSHRLWIDGKPVYRTRESAGLDNWERWKGDQGVTLQVQGFRGLVEHIHVWERTRA